MLADIASAYTDAFSFLSEELCLFYEILAKSSLDGSAMDRGVVSLLSPNGGKGAVGREGRIAAPPISDGADSVLGGRQREWTPLAGNSPGNGESVWQSPSSHRRLFAEADSGTSFAEDMCASSCGSD